MTTTYPSSHSPTHPIPSNSTGPYGPYLTYQAYQQGYIAAIRPSNTQTYEHFPIQGILPGNGGKRNSLNVAKRDRGSTKRKSEENDDDDDDEEEEEDATEDDRKPVFDSRFNGGKRRDEQIDAEGQGNDTKSNHISTPTHRRQSVSSQHSNGGTDGGGGGDGVGGGGGGGAGGGGLGGNGISGSGKRKKPRIALSCAQCTKRKQKCNRNIPCQHCINRKIPELCVPYVPGAPIPSPTSTSAAVDLRALAVRSQITSKEQSPSVSPFPRAIPRSEPVVQASSPRIKPGRSTSVRIASSSRGKVNNNGSAQTYASNDEFHHALHRLSRVEDILGIQADGSPSTSRTHVDQGSVDLLMAPQPIRRHSQTNESRSDSDDLMDSSNEQSNKGIRNGQDRALGAAIIEGFSRSTSAGEGGSVDAAKWFATETTVPNVEGLRGANGTFNLDLSDCGNPAENLQRLIKECGVSPLKLMELVEELPPYQFARKLVDYFFRYIDFVRYPIHEDSFREAFEDMYKRKGEVEPEPGNVRSLPLIFIVLATASRLAPEEWAGDDRTRRLNSLRMYWCSRRSILIATAIQPESLELVVTRMLSGLYLVLIHDRRLTECWSQLGASLRTAQAIGLHRDGTKLGLDHFQTEYRRRVWSYLYHADRNWSLNLGRPPSIDDAYCDAKEPSNVEWSELTTGQPIVSRPLNEPTTATFIILRKRFATIVGKIVHHFQKLHEPAKFEDVEALDKEISQFIEVLPPHYRMEGADKSLDTERVYIPLHRYYLSTEILSIIITLHRPWLLRRLRSDKFALSRRACFEAAKQDFRIRQTFRRDYPGVHNHFFGGQFREFNAAMIAGIAAIIFPRSEDADEMRAILAAFLEQNAPATTTMRKDQTSRKEFAIISTLHRRALQGLELDEASTSGHPSESVALLLGLRERDHSMKTEPDVFGQGTPTDPAFSKGDSTMAHFNNLYRAVVENNKPSEVGKDQVVAGAHAQQVANAVNGHHVHARGGSIGGKDHSPSSTLTNEDERPQKLLDMWLSSNNSLAVGGTSGGLFDDVMGINTFDNTLPMDMVATGGNANFIPYPAQTQGIIYPNGPFPSAGPGRLDNNLMTYPSGFNVDGPLLSLPNVSTGPSAQGPGPMMTAQPAGHGQMGGGSVSMDRGVSGGLGSQSFGGMQMGDPGMMDDSYWNALIDGILNST